MEEKTSLDEQLEENKLKLVYKLQKEITTLERTASLVDWDQKTYMPAEGIQDCSEKISLLSRLAHERFTSKEFKDSVDYLLQPDNLKKLNEKDKTIVKRLYKDIEKSSKLPTEFVENMSRLTTNAETSWEKAKKENSFEIFKPYLEEIIELKKEQCKLINLPGHPYNSLLDDFEEGMTIEKLNDTFSFLGTELTKLLKKIQSSGVYKTQNEDLFKRTFSHKKQEKISRIIKKLMNLPETNSRLDVSAHPFTTTIGNKDVRITTRYISNPLESLGSTIHEGGHALYELGLPQEYSNTVICSVPSLGIHESQSRFWENMIAKSESFWKNVFPIYQNVFKQQLKDVNLDDWFKLVNLVKPSFIRVEADEMTYCLHVILRYEIEKGMIEGSMPVKDLSKIWNDKFEQMFGIRPRNDREGVLQDIHWSGGAIGYFPTYALGSIYSTQLYSQLIKENSDITKEIEQGKLQDIISWLGEKVYKHGRSLTAEEIITKACGEGLNPEAYIKYLNDKYSKIYKF